MNPEIERVLSQTFQTDISAETVFIWVYCIIYILITGISLIFYTGIFRLKGYRTVLFRDIRITAIVPLVHPLKKAKELKLLEENVESLLKQSYPPEKIIIITGAGYTLPDFSDLPEVEIQEIDEIPPNWNSLQFYRYRGSIAARTDHLMFISWDCRFEDEGLTQLISYYQEEDRDTVISLIPLPAGRGANAVAELAGVWTPALCNCSGPLKSTGYRGILGESLILCRKETYRKIGTHRSIRKQPTQAAGLTRDFDDQHIRIETHPGTGLLRRIDNREAFHEYAAIAKGNYSALYNRRPYLAISLQLLWSIFLLTSFSLTIILLPLGYWGASIATGVLWVLQSLQYLVHSRLTGKICWRSAILLPVAIPWFWLKLAGMRLK